MEYGVTQAKGGVGTASEHSLIVVLRVAGGSSGWQVVGRGGRSRGNRMIGLGMGRDVFAITSGPGFRSPFELMFFLTPCHRAHLSLLFT